MTAVTLNVYDLSNGLAKQLSPMILGKTIDGIWHTGVLVYGREFYYGGGICSDPQGATPYGHPVSVIQIGTTTRTNAEFINFLTTIRHRFTTATYNLLTNNCNNFSSECVKFLCPGIDIPSYILDLPREALSSALGPMLTPMIDGMQRQIASIGGHSAFENPTTSSNPASVAAPPPLSPVSSAPAGAKPLPPTLASASHVPVILDSGDSAVVIKKLKEFAPESPAETLEDFFALLDSLSHEKIFPVLDLLRRNSAKVEQDATTIVQRQIQRVINEHILPETATRPSRMMALRLAANCFAFDSSARLMLESHQEALAEAVATGLVPSQHPAVQSAAAVVASNLITFGRKQGSLIEDVAVRITFCAVEWIQNTDLNAEGIAAEILDAAYFVLVGVGVIISMDHTARELCGSLELASHLQAIESSSKIQPRIITLAREVRSLL